MFFFILSSTAASGGINANCAAGARKTNRTLLEGCMYYIRAARYILDEFNCLEYYDK